MKATNKRHCVRFTKSLTLIASSVLVLLLAAVLLSPDAANAQNCVTSVANNVGDSITITGILTTTDPNENGEGEPVIFTSSGGELSGAIISDYGLAHTFTYTAVQANETITGINVGADFDEGCSVSAVVTAKALKFGLLTQADRDALETASKTLVIAGGAEASVAVLCAESIIAIPWCSLPLGSAGAITALEGAVLDLIATDPSDPNFTVIAQPQFLTVPPVVASATLTQAEADAFNALFSNEETSIAYGQVLITSYNRAQGAFDAGNAFWEAQQLQVAAQYQSALLTSLAAEGALRTALANLLSADPNFSGFSLTSSEALEAEQIIASGGLPPDITSALQDLGADISTISKVTTLLFVQDINAVSGNLASQIASPTLLSALNTLINTVTTPCNFTCPADITTCNDVGVCGTAVTFTPTSTGACGAVTCTPASGSVFAVGTTPVTCTTGTGASCSFNVTVNDCEAPQLICSVGTRGLFPPNGNLSNVEFTATAVDNCDGRIPVANIKVQVFSDEDELAPGSGNFSPDAKNLSADGSLRLRAERSGSGDGRVYLIVAKATDSFGNTGFCTSTVTVPHDQSANALASVTKHATAAQAYAVAHNGTPPPGYFAIGNGPIVGPKQ